MACKLLLEELPVPGGSPGGMEAFRCSLSTSFFFKFYLTVRLRLEQRTVSGLFLFYYLAETIQIFVLHYHIALQYSSIVKYQIQQDCRLVPFSIILTMYLYCTS
jgi:hypothetical protein